MKTDSLIQRKTFGVFDGDERKKRLPGLCLDLLSEQKKTWDDLRRGCDSLADIVERDLFCGGFAVRLQHNPERIKNTLADVRNTNTEQQRCFLCLDNLPEKQKGVLYRGEYLILCNPRPIFPAHFTISHLNHRPQALLEVIPAFLRLVTDFGPGWTVFYNGPKCGASAPHHLHFQAAPSGRMPIEKEVLEEKRPEDPVRVNGVLLYRLKDLGREVAVMEADEPVAVEGAFNRLIGTLQRILAISEEPMMNAAGFHERDRWRLLIFPRRKHRPAAFFREGDNRVVVSPGLIDMGGVLITPVKKDFESLDAAAVRAIYKEVSLEPGILQKAAESLFHANAQRSPG